jgi:hypothetical protein
VPTTAPPAPTTSTTARPARPPQTTTTAPAPGGTTVTLPPGVPWPTSPLPTSIGRMQPASSWGTGSAGVTAEVRMEPAAPVAGQPVTFRIDYSSPYPCCTVMLSFGDGSGFSRNATVDCSTVPAAGAQRTTTTHTYAAAGSYKIHFSVMTFPCGHVGPPSPLSFHGAQFDGCVGVGPGPAAQKGCSPFPPYGPDDIVSPTMDPFCEIRSDCTKASTPRPGWDG